MPEIRIKDKLPFFGIIKAFSFFNFPFKLGSKKRISEFLKNIKELTNYLCLFQQQFEASNKFH